MTQYRKKPVVIEAARFLNTPDAWRAVRALTGDKIWRVPALGGGFMACIDTLEGRMTANEGDWIIKGVKGELYPCKPDDFAATYEPITEDGKAPAKETSGEVKIS